MSYGPQPLDPAVTDFPGKRCPQCGSLRNRLLGAVRPGALTMVRCLDCPMSFPVRDRTGPAQDVALLTGVGG